MLADDPQFTGRCPARQTVDQGVGHRKVVGRRLSSDAEDDNPRCVGRWIAARIAEVESGRHEGAPLRSGCTKHRGSGSPDQSFLKDGVDVVSGTTQPCCDRVPKVLVELDPQTGSTVTSWNLVNSAP
jgi:hypothetical protein